MQFGLLGPMEVVSEQGTVRIRSRMQRRLLAVLLVHARTVVSADRLIDVLWSAAAPPMDARQSLWTCVARLRHTLAEQAGTARDDLLVSLPPGYLLAATQDQIDAGRFERLVSSASRIATDQAQTAAELLDQALALWRGPVLQEFADEPFVAAEAARLDELHLAAAEDRFEIDIRLGAHPTLIGKLTGFSALHPLRERPRAQLMLALYRSGRHVDALHCFGEYRELLDRELGLEPSAMLRSLQTQILQQSSELDWRGPPGRNDRPTEGLRSAADAGSASDNRLPVEVTSFVGREQDLAATAAAIAGARLVTLTGIGGVGKTRLAIRTAALASPRFVDGLSWCELAPVTDPAAVAPAVATSFGVQREAGATVVESVVAFLADKQMLLVLDNCEHLLVGVRPLVSAILQGCPRVLILATSRERLAIDGERARPVAPLPLPDSGSRPDPTNPAVSLFVDRARAVRPDLRLDEQTLADIVNICRRLDGLPLALELAAARMRSLNPADISDRVRTRLDLLELAHDHPGRHSTLRAVLDWSYGLLATGQQRLFGRLSVFAGDFDLDAVHAVCSGRGIERHQVVDLLTGLVDASMITVGPTEGTIRYMMLETVRHYAAECVGDVGEAEIVRQAHARHYTVAADQADRGLRGPDEAVWVSAVDRDLDNLRAAHRWMIGAAQADLALQLCRGLRYYMLLRFRDEVVTWGESSLELPGAEQHQLFAEVCGAVGEGMTARGDLGRALSLAGRALEQLKDPDDERRIYPLRVAGMVALYVGRLDDAFDRHVEMLRLAQMHAQPYEAGMALLGLAQSCTYAGDPGRGFAFAEEQLRVVEPLRNPSMVALALYDQAEAMASIDPVAAIEPYRRAVDLAQSAGSTFVEGIALVGLASLLGRSEEPTVALPLFRSIVDRWREMRVWHHQWTTLRNLVQLFLRTGNWDSAAVLLAAVNAGSTAAPAFGADADLMATAAEQLEHLLGPSRWSAAEDSGAAMSAHQTVAFACEAIDLALTSGSEHS